MKSAKLAIEGGKLIRDVGKRPFPSVPIIDEEDMARVIEVLKTGKLTCLFGAMVRKFEEEFSAYYGVKHAIATSSGTTALHAAIEAAGIGPGDEVITSPTTFIATANAILQNNAIPVFADIDPKTYDISPDSISEKITDRTRAILPVHIYGHPCDMDPIMDMAEDHNLVVIEDCAQANGAEYKRRNVGTIGDGGCFSLWESKNIGTGEGGVVITDSDELAEKVRSVINHYRPRVSPLPNIPPWMVFVGLGYNYRMTELQGALGIGQVHKLDRFNSVRERIADLYLKELKGVQGLILPYVAPDVRHVWYMFVCTINRDEIKATVDELVNAINAEFGVTPETGFLDRVASGSLMPIYLQPVLAKRIGYAGTTCPFACPLYGHEVKYEKGMCPNAENFSDSSLALFINHAMSLDDARDVVKGVKKVLSTYAK